MRPSSLIQLSTHALDDDLDWSDGAGPQPLYAAKSFKGLRELAQTVYPEDNIAHFFYLICYMVMFYGLLHLLLHCLNIYLNKRYIKIGRAKQGDYRANIVSPIHSLSSVYFAVYAMFYVCGEG